MTVGIRLKHRHHILSGLSDPIYKHIPQSFLLAGSSLLLKV